MLNVTYITNLLLPGAAGDKQFTDEEIQTLRKSACEAMCKEVVTPASLHEAELTDLEKRAFIYSGMILAEATFCNKPISCADLRNLCIYAPLNFYPPESAEFIKYAKDISAYNKETANDQQA